MDRALVLRLIGLPGRLRKCLSFDAGRGEMDSISVLIVEPDPIRREGLAACLERESDIRLVGMGQDYVEACKSSSGGSSIDVLLMNLDNPRMACLRDWSLLRALLPDVRIAGLTDGRDDRVLEAALAGGVVALQRLQAEPVVISRAARHAAAGLLDFDVGLMDRLKMILMQPADEELHDAQVGAHKSVVRGMRTDGDTDPADHEEQEALIEGLSPRETQVLRLMARGMDNKQIASRLKVSVSTTKYHVGNIYGKLGVRSRVRAVLVGLEKGWIAQE